MKPPRHEELWAAGCVRAALPGVVIGHHDRNLGQQHDFDLSWAGGTTFGALEVTAAADDVFVKSWKILYPGDGVWQDERIVGGWKVRVRPGPKARNITALKRELPAVLLDFEQAGRTELRRYAPQRDSLDDALLGLGVVRAHQAPTNFPGSIYPMPELPAERAHTFMSDTGDPLSDWVDRVVVDPKQTHNLTKLAASGAVERHLFLLVPGFETTAPLSVTDVLVRGVAPVKEPALPRALTHIWVASGWKPGCGFRWDRTRGWVAFAHDEMMPVRDLIGCTCS